MSYPAGSDKNDAHSLINTENGPSDTIRATRIAFDKLFIDAVDMEQAVERIACAINSPKSCPFHVITPNAQFVAVARRHARFRDILQSASLSVADGVPLVWASWLLGQPLPGRVNGTDLMVRLCSEAAVVGWKVYFLGGKPGAAEGAAQRLMHTYPDLRLAGVDCPDMGFMDDQELDSAASARIERASPDVLFVGLGAPKQEYWIHEHRHLSAKVMIGIGGSFELVAGITKRAPIFLQKAGCEWLWRLALEPRRLWKRYVIGNSIFVLVVIGSWLGKSMRWRPLLFDTDRRHQ